MIPENASVADSLVEAMLDRCGRTMARREIKDVFDRRCVSNEEPQLVPERIILARLRHRR